MQVVIRTDASLMIGSGHVMRCLTLANALRDNGANVHFICRKFAGNLIPYIQSEGFKVFTLEHAQKPMLNLGKTEQQNDYADWLEVSQQEDAEACRPLLEVIQPEWMIVDHYAIDSSWHLLLNRLYAKLMVIDDLANRPHQCHLLLDQTYGRLQNDYQGFVPERCQLLLGSRYALLRSEFNRWREYSIQRRKTPQLKRLLISMGGVDLENVTAQILQALNDTDLKQDLEVIVVLGAQSPHLERVKQVARKSFFKVEVRMKIANMAEIMANCDLAIGAAGATSWERCCLGLPTIMMVLAENQRTIARNLIDSKVAWLLEGELNKNLPALFSELTPKCLADYSQNAFNLVDGQGCQRVVNELGF